MAASAGNELWLEAEGDLARHADALAAAGWDVVTCDDTSFGACVALPTEAWVERMAGIASKHHSSPVKTQATRRRAREPGEPRPGDQLLGIGVGQGIGTVVKVERRDGKWTRVKVAYATGCMPVPEYEGQPAREWQVPSGAMWLTREEVERLRNR
jgi:hypothetical protein